MAEDTQMEGKAPEMEPPKAAEEKKKKKKKERDHYTIVPLPKVVFFYPLMLTSLACGFMQMVTSSKLGTGAENYVAGTIFLAVFLVNVMVIAFDFPGVKALALVMCLVAIVLGTILFDQNVSSILGPLSHYTKALCTKLGASYGFYFVITAVLFVMITGGVLGNVLWDRWTIETNRLRHKDGLLSYKDYPVIDLKVEKDVEDIFEFLLLASGTLTFRVPDNPSFRLENVPFINRTEQIIQTLVREWSVKSK